VNKLEAFLVRLIATVIIAAAISIVIHGAQAAPLHHAGHHPAGPTIGMGAGAESATAVMYQNGDCHTCNPGACSGCSICCAVGLQSVGAPEDLPTPVSPPGEASLTRTLSGVDPIGIRRPPRLDRA
jgi:hypothetical protein